MTGPAAYVPLRPTRREVTAIGAIALANVALNRAVPPGLQVPASLAAAGCMALLARNAGAGLDAQGLSPDAAWPAARTGAALAIPIGGVLAFGALIPGARNFYRDRSIIAARPGEAAYQMLVRIPIATAACEELIFRSAFEGLLALRRPRWQVMALSAPLFGLWHVLPALDQSASNPAVIDIHRGSGLRRLGVIIATFTFTACAGLGLSWLRARTQSVVAPMLVHAAVNIGGFAGGWLAARASLGRERS